MHVNWKSLRVTFGQWTVRLKTIVAAFLCGAIGILLDLQSINLDPIITYFVADDKKAAFYGVVVTIVFSILRAVTNGPLIERAPVPPPEEA